MKKLLLIILSMVVGLWKYFSRKNTFKREQVKKAQDEIKKANETNDPSDLLDAFSNID